MSDQPTTWTTEIDLAIGGVVDSAQDGANARRWPMNAVKKLKEVIAAEIERLREENEEIRRENGAICVCKEALDKEIERLRAELAAKQPVKAEAAQQGPSDEEIRDAIRCVETWGCKHTASALRKVARRAGVKL